MAGAPATVKAAVPFYGMVSYAHGLLAPPPGELAGSVHVPVDGQPRSAGFYRWRNEAGVELASLRGKAPELAIAAKDVLRFSVKDDGETLTLLDGQTLALDVVLVGLGTVSGGVHMTARSGAAGRLATSG